MMNDFFRSFKPILKRLRKFKIELLLLCAACIITVIILLLYSTTSPAIPEQPGKQPAHTVQSYTSYVDISGAVQQPGVYAVSSSARLRDIIILAGGLSDNADKDYFTRNFNLAKFIFDQEKIHVPSFSEIQMGLFTEPQHSIEYLLPVNKPQLNNNSSEQPTLESGSIHINSATVEELDILPGVGQATAQKIIQNRPYQTMDELLTKKIVKQNVYDQIKDLIVLD